MVNSFSFSNFYSRRIRRIFPALIAVTSACYAFGWFALFPNEFKQLGLHIAAGIGFVQNFVLWSEAGYFDVASDLKPLLHLWSLAIEEQFYLLYPLLVWLLWRAGLQVMLILVAVALTSFAISWNGVHLDPVKYFFATHTRIWELLVGSIVAYIHIHGLKITLPSFSRTLSVGRSNPNNVYFWELRGLKIRSSSIATWLSILGLALIGFSVLFYDSKMSYPGSHALAPVFGAAFLIIAGPQALVNRHVLGLKILVWIGLISYPLYLWHWPLLSFARVVESENPPVRILSAVVALSFVLAALTYWVIEKPIRYGSASWQKVAALCVLATVIGYVGYEAYLKDGLEWRGPIEALAKDDKFSDKFAPWSPANQDERCKALISPPSDNEYCRISKHSKPTILIIGDSHASTFYPGLSDVVGESSENVVVLGKGNNPAFINVGPSPLFSQLHDISDNLDSIHTVILWFRGPLYLTSKGFYYDDYADEKRYNRKVRSTVRPDLTDQYAIWNFAMRETLDRLVTKKNVIFVLDNPELGFHPRTCFDTRPVRVTNRVRKPCAVSRKDFDQRNLEYRKLVDSILRDYPKVKLFDAAAQLCDSEWCWAARGDSVLYFDDDHLSSIGARMMADELVKLLR